MRFFLGRCASHSVFVLGAQLQADPIQTTLSTTITPELPKPNEKVSIQIESFSFDLNRAIISWSINGKKQREGKGVKSFDFTVGALGSASSVTVYIVPGEGNPPFSETFRFYPTEVSLISEAKTFVPLFFRGKSGFSEESDLRISALPNIVDKNGNMIPRENLIYTWTRDSRPVQEASGYGMSTYSLTGAFSGAPEYIGVTVSSEDGLLKASGSIRVKPIKPILLFYENNPLFGILYNKAITSKFIMKEKETSFTAVPYGITRVGNGDVAFHWSVNNEPTQINQNGDTITVRNDSGTEGDSLIGLSIDNPKKIFQALKSGFSVTLTKTQ
jgi:hypothetical protein